MKNGPRLRVIATTAERVRIRRHVTDDDLAAFERGELTGIERKRIGRHLDGCLTCGLNLARLGINRALLESDLDDGSS